mgnify:CR=1 FL=1
MGRKITLTLHDFERWLRDRGYDKRMGEQNLRLFLDMGLAGLFFLNSALLMGYIFSSLGLPSERISDNIRFEVGRKVKDIKASRDYLEIEIG